MDFSKLDDKRVFVTGAADGIGAALARAFRAAGARVFLSDVAEERLRETATALDAPGVACDVRNPTSLARVVERAWRELGGLDLVCANAGVVVQGPLLEASREELDFIFGINAWGALDTCRPFVRLLRENKKPGHILLTGSEAALSYPELIRDMQIGAYLMTKHSVLAMADGLRADLRGDGIGVSVLCPGPVATSLSQNSSALRAGRAAVGPVVPTAGLGPEAQARVGALSVSPDQIAARALEGLRRGLFVIPTHPHIAADVEARHAEIRAGLDALAARA
ncbi:MAG: SDR family NAD(P)-dependent oxidoreductase [Deltaproteobacteria bacterium]|nr:SDR family NAD(P)-dependent oxidoreductase [Deltaproteobacteria bacterium]